MKKYIKLGVLTGMLFFMVAACSKKAVIVNNNNPSNGPGSNLFPFKAGNVWIYQDSLWDSTKTLSSIYSDTAYLTTSTLNYSQANGGLLYNFIDPKGVFGSCYFGTSYDNNGNGLILEYDGNTNSPYIFFATSSAGDSLVDSWRTPNASCSYSSYQYSYIATTQINGYTCFKNIITTTNCNNINTENYVEYVSPAVGIVRLENWVQDTTGVNKPLYLQYSQTLQKFIPK
jgi:hypothetical protein